MPKYFHSSPAHEEGACCTSHSTKTAGSSSHNHEHNHEHEHNHGESDQTIWRMFLPCIISFALLILGLILDHWIKPNDFKSTARLVFYLVAYLPVAWPVIKDAFQSIRHGDVFSEFFLMTVATFGAIALGEYPEAVAVMLFYATGEIFQSMAVSRARNDIKSLLDQRPDEVNVLHTDGTSQKQNAKQIPPGTIIQVLPGEKIALDGELISDTAILNTAALTGESVPVSKQKGDAVLAGMIAINQPFTFKTTTTYADSKLSKILKLVQEASAHKAPTELFIRKFARVYTPIVVFSAIAICLLPMFFLPDYHFNDWLYRSLVFLVVSCPCALVISIPLGYFGGIGAGSRNGILFKGSNYLDLIAKLDHLVTDKTGTITEGVFQVQEVKIADDFQQTRLLAAVNLLESHSNHPVAKAVHSYLGAYADDISLESIEEIAGHGLKAVFDGKPLLLGNFKLLNKFSISYPKDDENSVDTLVAIAYDGRYVGYLAIADKIKDDAKTAVDALTEMGIQVTMLSGDRTAVVDKVAKELGIAHAKGDLLPEDKVLEFQAIKQKSAVVGFVGDGINDAPVVALSDIGLAMGGLGSDATIETADIIIQDDNPLRIAMAVQIGKKTKQIVWQNIGFAFGVKLIVLLLGAGGLATLWEAVFADVGVALLAILNAVRIQRMKF